MHFYGLNLAWGHLGPWDLGLNKLGKGPPGYAKFQASEPSSSGKEDFEVYIIFEPKTPPPQGHFRPQGHHSNKLGRGPLGNATYKYQGPRPSSFRGDVVQSNC